LVALWLYQTGTKVRGHARAACKFEIMHIVFLAEQMREHALSFDRGIFKARGHRLCALLERVTESIALYQLKIKIM
jgi:hypothetical protein